ncbi:spore photoproduct lyase [Caldanaerovirga acetigignens]|uniref:Spore photoproduct lyase n=1 Tax=Caldanaerovirga acetigignens TaxID=447595 RepID=A0A1M7JU53_9FIRM|nr:DNA repair photolyase [Caldanaerovirga acetigignens]SHM56077.1 spore photoproduct lyase [Caldanaerovirga acetigignens]
MKGLKKCFVRSFSHIYVEEGVEESPLTKEILKKFPKAVKVRIKHYKDVFCRPRQNFFVQESSRKLIIAAKKGELLYQGPDICHSFGNENFYYASPALNCVYSCDYCYLKGMYASANLVIFVNVEDFFKEIEDLIRRNPIYLSISYDTDLLALERIAPLCTRWIEFARGKEDLKLEIRTKSANYSAISYLAPACNVILAWTLSPDEAIKKYEKNAPPLELRLKNVKKAIGDGWNVRLCFDPVLYFEDWEAAYENLISRTFSVIPADKIKDASIGVFRIPRDYLKRMRRNFPPSEIIHYPYTAREGVYTYDEKIKRELTEKVWSLLIKHVPEDKIFVL